MSAGRDRTRRWIDGAMTALFTSTGAVAILFIFLIFLWQDAWEALWWDNGAGGKEFGIGVGSIVMLVDVTLLSGYTLGCHSTRHVIGGMLDRISLAPARKRMYDVSTACNRGPAPPSPTQSQHGSPSGVFAAID